MVLLFVVELFKLVIWETNRRNNGKLSIWYSIKIDINDLYFAYNQFVKLLAVVSRLSHTHTTPPATHATS